MRPILALVILLGIPSSLWLYITYRPRPAALGAVTELVAPGKFALEVTLTFPAGPDPFALQANDSPSLLIQYRGRDLLRRTDALPAGTILRTEDLPGLYAGPNEFYVMATCADGEVLGTPRALRIRLLRDGTLLSEQTMWAEPGDPVQGLLSVDLPRFAAPLDAPGAPSAQPAPDDRTTADKESSHHG